MVAQQPEPLQPPQAPQSAAEQGEPVVAQLELVEVAAVVEVGGLQNRQLVVAGREVAKGGQGGAGRGQEGRGGEGVPEHVLLSLTGCCEIQPKVAGFRVKFVTRDQKHDSAPPVQQESVC